jgi:hypothetical protein
MALNEGSHLVDRLDVARLHMKSLTWSIDST